MVDDTGGALVRLTVAAEEAVLVSVGVPEGTPPIERVAVDDGVELGVGVFVFELEVVGVLLRVLVVVGVLAGVDVVLAFASGTNVAEAVEDRLIGERVPVLVEERVGEFVLVCVAAEDAVLVSVGVIEGRPPIERVAVDDAVCVPVELGVGVFVRVPEVVGVLLRVLVGVGVLDRVDVVLASAAGTKVAEAVGDSDSGVNGAPWGSSR